MKIRSVTLNNHKKVFEVRTANRNLRFPYSKSVPKPTVIDPVATVTVDKELGREGFTYVLKSGKEGSIHIEQVLDYNDDPGYSRHVMVYRLTIEAQKRLRAGSLSKREISRRLRTSATQLYRLLDQTNYKKSVDQLLALLHVLDCTVDLKVRAKPLPSRRLNGVVPPRE